MNPMRRTPTPSRATARHPDRGNHRGVRGRDADGALPRRRADRPVGADRRPREGGGAGVVLPGDPGVQQHRRRHARAAGDRHQRVPRPRRASDARGLHTPGRDAQRRGLRPGRTAAGRGGEDDVGSLRRQGQPGPGVLRDDKARRDGARVGPFLVVLRLLRAQRFLDKPCRSRRGRAHRHAVVSARQAAAARPVGGGRRHLRHRQAESRRDRRHPFRQVRPAGAQAMDDARTAAADRGAATGQDRRGQAVGRLAATGRRGSDATYRAEPGNPSDRVVVHGRGPFRCRPRRAFAPVWRRR